MFNSKNKWRMGGFLGTLTDAISVSNAVRERRQPNAHSLRRLGIDPEQFNRIGRFN